MSIGPSLALLCAPATEFGEFSDCRGKEESLHDLKVELPDGRVVEVASCGEERRDSSLRFSWDTYVEYLMEHGR